MNLAIMAQAKSPEAFSRVIIDAQLRNAKWKLTDGRSVRYEYVLPDGTKVDYVLGGRYGRALAVVEAKRRAIGIPVMLRPLNVQRAFAQLVSATTSRSLFQSRSEMSSRAAAAAIQLRLFG